MQGVGACRKRFLDLEAPEVAAIIVGGHLFLFIGDQPVESSDRVGIGRAQRVGGEGTGPAEREYEDVDVSPPLQFPVARPPPSTSTIAMNLGIISPLE